MTLVFGRDESHPMVDALLRARVPRWEELNRAIDERDDMLDFAVGWLGHDRDRALTSYFQSGIEQFQLVRHVARWRDNRPRRMLDFASGYGRLTRFLVHESLADQIVVSDILDGGMAFQSEEFGVRTLPSTTLPDDFVCDERFDLIFVASLFTHLPPSTFTLWLHRLASMLEPEGLLIFSVHDESIAPRHVDGILFDPSSESRVLGVEEYGSTWVTEAYVREQVESIDARFACFRMPRALSDWQDVYVLSPAPILNPTPRPVPKGVVERCDAMAEGLHLLGWAFVLGSSLDRVELRMDDEVVGIARDFSARSDTAAFLGLEGEVDCCWEIVVPYERIRSFRYRVATISAFAGDVERILFLGTIDSLRGQAETLRADQREKELAARGLEMEALGERLRVTEQARGALEQQIAAMRQSRFWRARDRWFAFKRAMGWTDEA
jgi:SAM-dependent methyltransferase